jgi:ethanolamine utilization protein EutN
MQLAKVIGHATATIKHPSLEGWRLMIAHMVNVAREPEGDPLVVVDKLGCGIGQTIVIDSDGKGARELIGNEKTPARWYSIAVVDE